jgi:hypothetical protein
MSYRIGDVEMQGTEPADNNVIRAAFTPKVVDGGKARIKARRYRLFPTEGACDLSMREADTAPCDYVAPAWDGA